MTSPAEQLNQAADRVREGAEIPSGILADLLVSMAYHWSTRPTSAFALFEHLPLGQLTAAINSTASSSTPEGPDAP